MNDQTPSPQASDDSELSFETAMQQLEALVNKIETGDLSLEDSLQEFEKGIQLSRVCQSALRNAEQRVKILSGDEEHDFSEMADQAPLKD